MTIASEALDVLTGAASGAAAGAALGPVGAGVGGAIGLAMKLVPDLAKAIGGDTAGTVASKVVQTVQDVTGSAHPGAQAAAIADPQVEADLRVSLGQIAADHDKEMADARTEALKATLADVAGARAQTQSLAAAGSSLAWGAPVVSTIVALGFFAAIAMLVFARIELDPGRAAMLNILVGTLGGGFTSVIAYWIGSSAGSNKKTDLLAQR